RLVVVGGGNSAVQETIFLTRYATHIDLLVRGTLKASDVLLHELQKYVDEGKVAVHLSTVSKEIVTTDGKVSHVAATKDGEEVKLETDGVFVFVGLKPNTQFLKDSGIELDVQGLVKTDHHLETTMKGVFASGDVRS